MSEYIRDLGDDPAQVAAGPATLDSLQAQLAAIAAQQKADEESRKWSTALAVAGALFAAVKLGVIVIPHIRRRHAEATGTVANPHKRRSRRRH